MEKRVFSSVWKNSDINLYTFIYRIFFLNPTFYLIDFVCPERSQGTGKFNRRFKIRSLFVKPISPRPN